MTPASDCVLEVEGLVKRFPARRDGLGRWQWVHAVNGVSFQLGRGETLGLVGESGSGKSTVARLAMGLLEPTSGSVSSPTSASGAMRRSKQRARSQTMQMVFQDPHSSFDPNASVGDSIAEPLRVHRDAESARLRKDVDQILDKVGLPRSFADRRPSELSGGQLQRAAIARALVVEPEMLVLDEPVSALDVSTQAQIINLLQDLQADLGTAYLFIAHDLSVVQHISHRIAVMYLGRIVEEGEAESVYSTPSHPYTQALLSAVPVPDPIRQRSRRRIVLEGSIPSPLVLPTGCHLHGRCPYAMEVCRTIEPSSHVTPGDTRASCHLFDANGGTPADGGDATGHNTTRRSS